MPRIRTVLFVNGSADIEGDTRVLINTARSLDPERFRPVCITPPGDTAAELRSSAIDVVEAPLGPSPSPAGRITEAARMARATFATVMASRRVRADIIYTYDRTRAAESAFVAAKLLRRPLVFHAHYPLFLEQRRMRRFVAFRASRIVANSDYVAGMYLRSGAPAERVRTVLLAVEPPPSTDSVENLRERLAIPREARVVGIVGRLSPYKGQEELIRAVHALRGEFPDLFLIIAGRDTDESIWTHGPHATSYRAVLERVVAELHMNDRVHILGFHASARAVYAASDIVAAPSHAEPFGLVIIEAMLARRPVISCSAGGPLEIITDGETGLLVPPQSPGDLAGAIRRLLEDGTLRQRIADAGYAHATERFTLARYARDFQAVLDEL